MRLPFTFFVFLIAISSCQVQVYDPLSLAKAIFAKDTFPDLERYCTGEYKGHPNGTDLSPDISTSFLLLGQTDETAVVSLTVIDSSGKEFDSYLHLVKDSLWKVAAFRGLAMTGLIYQVHEMLQSLTKKQVDSIISRPDDDGYRVFTSREEYKFLLGNTGLIVASDRQLIDHFERNRKKFNKIKSELENEGNSDEAEIRIGATLKDDYRKLFIASIETGGFTFGNALNFRIGGMLDNNVGYLYVKNKENLPEMNPSNLIMIREIGDGWYIYKTT